MRARILAGVMAGLVLVLGAPASAARAADDYLVTSNPAPHDELDNPPGWVTLVFKTDASAKLAKIVVQNSRGLDVTTGDIIVEGSNATVQLLSNLPKDTFTVTYRTSDAKGNPRGGTFQFAFGSGTWTNVDDTWVGASEQPTVIASPPSPAPEETATASSTAESPAPSGQSTAPTAEPEQPSQDGSPNSLWWYLGGGAILIAAAVGIVLGRRRRANTNS